MVVPVIGFPAIPIIRVLGLAVAALVLIWCVHYRGGLALVSDNKPLIFNVHPVLMVIGLLLLNGEAMLAYKTITGTKTLRKFVHLSMQLAAFCLSLIGVWAAWKFHNEKGVDNCGTASIPGWELLACSSSAFSGLLGSQVSGTRVARETAELQCFPGMPS